MKYTIISSIMLAFILSFAGFASAQVASVGVMPVLYNSSGQTVNASGGTLQAGTYYLLPGAISPVYYSSDGTYYNPSSHTFGGSVYNPTGQAGTYNIPAGSTSVVGVPNTGAGGNAAATWTILSILALASVAGAGYLARTSYVHKN